MSAAPTADRTTSSPGPRLRRALRHAVVYLAVVAVTLLVIDLLLITFGVFPPHYDYGNPDLGWLMTAPDPLPFDWCYDYSRQRRVDYYRNELAIRTPLTPAEIRESASRFMIAAVGDSHSDQCLVNAETHQGILESELNRAGVETLVLSSGVGGYSPLQSYLLFKLRLRSFAPDALLLNVYTGNDFNDLLRVDDRPHFVPDGDEYRIAPPVWYRFYDPDVQHSSRVMFVARALLDRVGARNLYLRLLFLGAAAGREGEGPVTVLRYMDDVRKSREPSIGYSGALSAQFLNQQLFMHHFPASEQESLRRMRFLMRMIRAENPDLMLIMSPLPSYQLVGEEPVDAALPRVLDRLPLTYEGGIEEEQRLYYALRELSGEEGWLFVDNLQPLRDYAGSDRLFNDYDYHATEAASSIIGATEAEAIHKKVAHRPTDKEN